MNIDFEDIWKAWIVLFIMLETYALVKGRGNTLSEWIWRWFNVADGWSIERALLLAFCIWIVGHMAFMTWRGNPFG